MKTHMKKKDNLNVKKGDSSFEIKSGQINSFEIENDPMSNETIEEELIRDDKIYDENIVLGEKIASIITSGQTKEESLSKKNKYCLDLYRKNKALIHAQDVELKKWQTILMKYFSEEEKGPSYRVVIWVIGKRRNEGKTWFQSYVESYYGYRCLARFDLKSRAEDIFTPYPDDR